LAEDQAKQRQRITGQQHEAQEKGHDAAILDERDLRVAEGFGEPAQQHDQHTSDGRQQGQ